MMRCLQLFAVFILIGLDAETQVPSMMVTPSVRRAAIQQLERNLMDNYVFRDTARKMCVYLQHQLQSGCYDTVTDANHFAKHLTDDLSVIYHDKHLAIRYSPSKEKTLFNEAMNGPQEKMQETEEGRNQHFGFVKTEILEHNIGYIKLDQFWDFSPESRNTAQTALALVSNVHALIFDLRDNIGGDPEMVRFICGFLFNEPTHINDLYEPRINKRTAFWTNPDTSITALARIPIYILTSTITFSAAEEFAYDLQAQHRGMVIGEITGGGAHPLDFFRCGHGFVAAIPIQRAINPITKTNWEGSGVIPDIVIPARQALDKTINWIEGKN